MRIRANYYQQFDADYALDIPAEGYGGWKKTEIEIAPKHTALVVMHAWEAGTREKYPGWYRAVEFLPRANRILETVFPPLLAAVRQSRLKLYHVVSSSRYAQKYPGYERAVALGGPNPSEKESAAPDPVLERLREFRDEKSYVGAHNLADVNEGFRNLAFPHAARPEGDEGVAENGRQLFTLCKNDGINHLIYTGFAINWCLLASPGGMVDMARCGFMCSTIRQAVTAVENKETARKELCKEIALWRVAVGFGFVFDLDDFLRALDGRQA